MIDMLPANVLLEIFDFYRHDLSSKIRVFPREPWRWDTLIQVCRRWRHIIFESPRRLDLRLGCGPTTPSKRLLDIWPPFPIIIMFLPSPLWADDKGVENIIAAIERRNRISEIYILNTRGSTLEKLIAVMHEPLPILTHVFLGSKDESPVPVLPNTFLGGCAPFLRQFVLNGIPFPTLPKFILSATYIDTLDLFDIPHAGYISPEVMATSLAALPNLKHFSLGFRSPLSRPLQSPPPLTRTVLPTLVRLSFTGVSEYLEDFLSRIHTPLLNRLVVGFFMDLIFDIPRLHDFVHRIRRSQPFNQASIWFFGHAIRAILGSQNQFVLEIKCERLDWQLSSMTQVFGQQLPLLSCVEQLMIHEWPWRCMKWKDDPDMDSSQWMELFRLFISAHSLYVSKRLVPHVGAALLELNGDEVMGVLPVLVDLYLEGHEPSGSMQEGIKSFVTSRQLSDQPVTVQRWDSEERLTVDYESEDD